MKILFLDMLHSHYLKNALYIGLKKILDENIDIFPLPDIDKESFTVKYNKKSFLNLKKIREKINSYNYDYIIIGWLNNYTVDVVRYILRNNKTASFKKIIIIDFDDIPYVRKIILSNKVMVYFKREKLINNLKSYLYLKKHLLAVLYHNLKVLIKGIHNNIFLNDLYLCPTNIIKNKKIYPIPLGVADLEKYYPMLKNIKKKEYDVSFIATPNTKERKIIFNILEELEKEYDIKCYINKGNLSFEKYLKIISLSKISINTYGYGVDTFRYYEIPYLNTMLLTKRPIIEIPNNFIDGKSAVFYNNVNEIKNLILHYLDNNKWEKIAKEGNIHVKKYFVDEKLAQYFLNIIEGGVDE